MVDTLLTRVLDVIEPSVFLTYVSERITQVNALFKCGIIATVPGVNLIPEGGGVVNMPFWQALTGRAQLLDDRRDLTLGKLAAKQDKAIQHMKALVYGASDLAGTLSGADPMRAIGDMLADNWAIELNNVGFYTLQGAMAALGAESPVQNYLDISALTGAAAIIDGASFIDAAQTLGDQKVQIAGVVMHSATEARLAKNDLIVYTQDSLGQIVLRTFMGKTVIVDDLATTEANGVYNTYLFGPGALAYAEGFPRVPFETERRALVNSGESYIVARRHFVLHPRGIAWNPTSGVPALLSPQDGELSSAVNWLRVYQPKNIRIVRFRHKIA